MRALGLEGFEDGPKVLELPDPQPSPGEVKVKVSHSSITGFDVGVAFGMVKDFMEHRFPVVLGKDFAGAVEAVGDGVSGFSEGDAVFGVLMREYVGDGTLADYVIVPEAIGLTKLPQELDAATAGALGLAGAAAHAGVAATSPSAGQTLLISGATGGVDAAIHLAGDGSELAGLVRSGGRFASTLGVGPDQLGDKNVEATAVMAMPTRDVLDALAQHTVAGELQVPIGRTYKLVDVPQAITDFAQGSLGKYAVTIS